MKKLLTASIFSFLIVALSITGCKKDSENSPTLLTGTWSLVSTTKVDYYDNIKQNETTTTYDPGVGVLELYDDGTGKKFLNGIISDAFYWVIEGNLIRMTNNYGVTWTVEYAVSTTDLTVKWAVENNVDGHMLRSDYMSIYKKA